MGVFIVGGFAASYWLFTKVYELLTHTVRPEISVRVFPLADQNDTTVTNTNTSSQSSFYRFFLPRIAIINL